jgi:N-glycosylase/DNA lyase
MYEIAILKKEYLTKKDKIKERLNHFQKFFNEPVSWHFSEGVMKLLPSHSNEDYRLFEELSFCIFTANTSAEMGMKAVDAVRHLLINGTPQEMKERLEGIYRFKNLRPSYIEHTRKHLKETIDFKLKKKLLSFQDRIELRDYIALNKDIKGIGYKEASHFLRNIGFLNYAILDKHIINSLHEFKILNTNDRPTNRKEYLKIEQKLKDFSKDIGINMDDLDLLLWSRKTKKILK